MLPNQRPPKRQAFTDGLIDVVRQMDTSPPGAIPNMQVVLLVRLPFRRRTIGYRRRESALVAGMGIDYMLECPDYHGVHANDYVRITANFLDPDDWYRIETIDRLEETMPPVMRLTLSKTAQIIELTEDGTL